uniref:Uncharacterized protein MANES_15G045200 n=1 Tax=Rhizophora mucronata TaxID=61149 RepID=A0A2P2PJ72_RHIMU
MPWNSLDCSLVIRMLVIAQQAWKLWFQLVFMVAL